MLATRAPDPLAAVHSWTQELPLAVPNAWSAPTVLLILGMARSGTTIVRHILGLMGAESGWVESPEDHSLIACVRHPLEVARSLERHAGLPVVEGLKLWHGHSLRLLERTTTGRRVYWFDFDSGPASSRRLIRDLAVDFPLDPTPEALSYVRPADWRHQEKGRLPGRVGDLYEVLRLRARTSRPS